MKKRAAIKRNKQEIATLGILFATFTHSFVLYLYIEYWLF
jgi:hypothetical protein